MSKGQIEKPDGRWVRGEWGFRPPDKQLCVVNTNENTVTIWQFRESGELIGDCFLCIDKSRYISWMFVDRWKPLGLPDDVNECIIAEIEKWFEEDE